MGQSEDAAHADWYELSFTIARDQTDALSDALLEVGALSVQVADAFADTRDEEAIFGEPTADGVGPPLRPWRVSRVSVLAASHEQGMAFLAQACEELSITIPRPVRSVLVEQQDWVSATQAQFDPFPIGEALWITPSWRQGVPVPADHISIVLDPGLAFGTGSHPTTSMCLQWLCKHKPAGQRVIDYGCGSGILAIAAAKLGASEVIGIDIDDQALTSAAENARINHVALTLLGTRQPMPEPAPLVLANILAGPLKVLAPLLEELVSPGGTLVLAGLLDSQVQAVSAAYPRTALAPWASEQGWTCLAGNRAAP